MSIMVRTATSVEMKKNKSIIRKMYSRKQFDENMLEVNWRAARKLSNLSYRFFPREDGVKGYRVRIGGTVSELSLPDNVKEGAVILYIHGGGFVSGSASASRSYASVLAKYTGYRVISAEYRLSPENKYPDALEDCYSILRVIRKKYPDYKVIIAGESAGGNMSIALALKARDRGRKSIAAVIVHSPLADLTGSLDRSEHEIRDFTIVPGFEKPMREAYVGQRDAESPYISPIFADFHGFPPIFITCDYNETLFADAMTIYRKCVDAGVRAEVVQMKNAFHAFATMGTRTPETEQILIDNADFIDQCLGEIRFLKAKNA